MDTDNQTIQSLRFSTIDNKSSLQACLSGMLTSGSDRASMADIDDRPLADIMHRLSIVNVAGVDVLYLEVIASKFDDMIETVCARDGHASVAVIADVRAKVKVAVVGVVGVLIEHMNTINDGVSSDQSETDLVDKSVTSRLISELMVFLGRLMYVEELLLFNLKDLNNRVIGNSNDAVGLSEKECLFSRITQSDQLVNVDIKLVCMQFSNILHKDMPDIQRLSKNGLVPDIRLVRDLAILQHTSLKPIR